MKIKIATLILFTLFISGYATAQYRNGGGLDRRISGQNQNYTPRQQTKKQIDPVQATTDKLTKQLNLDGFQQAVLKNIIEEYKNTSTSISEQEIPSELKYEKLKIAHEKMESQVLDILNEAQKIKFEDLKKMTGKNDKKKKKGKKEEDEIIETIGE